MKTEMSHPHPIAPLSMFFFPRANETARGLLDAPGLELTFNGRGALLRAFAEVAAMPRGKKVLVPAFHCPSAIGPALFAGLEPVFYRIRRDLTIDYEDVLAKAHPTVAAILVIHFFGVAPDLTPLEPLRRTGTAFIEDCSHSFLQANPVRLAGSPASDYRVFSLWKTVPSGVGGGLLRSSTRALPSVPQLCKAAPLKERARAYKLLLEESIEHSGHCGLRAALHSFESARAHLRKPNAVIAAAPPQLERGEVYYPLNPDVSSSSIPAHSRRIVAASDLTSIVSRRRLNFKSFAAQAGSLRPMLPLIPTLPEHTCPWVYPVLLDGRAHVDFKLKAAGVGLHTFGIYLHSALFERADECAIADATFLAERVLCLSIHQDLDEDDIHRAVRVIHRELGARLAP